MITPDPFQNDGKALTDTVISVTKGTIRDGVLLHNTPLLLDLIRHKTTDIPNTLSGHEKALLRQAIGQKTIGALHAVPKGLQTAHDDIPVHGAWRVRCRNGQDGEDDLLIAWDFGRMILAPAEPLEPSEPQAFHKDQIPHALHAALSLNLFDKNHSAHSNPLIVNGRLTHLRTLVPVNAMALKNNAGFGHTKTPLTGCFLALLNAPENLVVPVQTPPWLGTPAHDDNLTWWLRALKRVNGKDDFPQNRPFFHPEGSSVCPKHGRVHHIVHHLHNRELKRNWTLRANTTTDRVLAASVSWTRQQPSETSS